MAIHIFIPTSIPIPTPIPIFTLNYKISVIHQYQ